MNDKIKEILSKYKTIAMVGVSKDDKKPSTIVMKYMQKDENTPSKTISPYCEAQNQLFFPLFLQLAIQIQMNTSCMVIKLPQTPIILTKTFHLMGMGYMQIKTR